MAFEFKRLADVELLDKAPEGCSVLAEVDGVERRLPGEGLGSSSNALIFVGTMASDGGEEMSLRLNMLEQSTPEFESIVANMDFADAYAAYEAGEILSACVYCVQSEGLVMFPAFVFYATHYYGVESLAINIQGLTFYWTADGISTDEPAGER
jgi:hypothetical protein